MTTKYFQKIGSQAEDWLDKCYHPSGLFHCIHFASLNNLYVRCRKTSIRESFKITSPCLVIERLRTESKDKRKTQMTQSFNQYSENETKIWRQNILNQFNGVSSSSLRSHFVISLTRALRRDFLSEGRIHSVSSVYGNLDNLHECVEVYQNIMYQSIPSLTIAPFPRGNFLRERISHLPGTKKVQNPDPGAEKSS